MGLEISKSIAESQRQWRIGGAGEMAAAAAG